MCGRGGIGRRAALRSLWANPRGSSSLLGRTILPFVETYILQQIAFCVSILSGLCWTVLDTLNRKFRRTPEKTLHFTGKLICRFLLILDKLHRKTHRKIFCKFALLNGFLLDKFSAAGHIGLTNSSEILIVDLLILKHTFAR